MYKILTKASITNLLVGLFTGAQVSVASSSTCPSQLAPIDQTFNICTKLVNAQVGCVTNVDSYSLYACTYVASVIDISTIVDVYMQPSGLICCSDKITAVFRKNN